MTSADVISLIRMVVAEQLEQIKQGIEGVVVPGSYDPKNGWIDVLLGHSATLGEDGDTANEKIIVQHVPLLTNHVGDLGGPIGGERCVLIPIRGSWRVVLEHGPDDSPNAPQGEKWIHLRDVDPQLAKAAYLRIQRTGSRVAHPLKVVLLAPTVNLGLEDGTPDNGVARLSDLRAAIEGVIHSTQDAFSDLARRVQTGSGTPAPAVAPVAPTASITTFAK